MGGKDGDTSKMDSKVWELQLLKVARWLVNPAGEEAFCIGAPWHGLCCVECRQDPMAYGISWNHPTSSKWWWKLWKLCLDDAMMTGHSGTRLWERFQVRPDQGVSARSFMKSESGEDSRNDTEWCTLIGRCVSRCLRRFYVSANWAATWAILFHSTVLAKVLFWEPRRVFRRRQPMAVEDAQAFLMFEYVWSDLGCLPKFVFL